MENSVNNILGGIIAISNMFSNSQVNNRPKRKIRRYKTLSKQDMKEYAMKRANSNGFDWFEDEEEMWVVWQKTSGACVPLVFCYFENKLMYYSSKSTSISSYSLDNEAGYL